MRNIQRLANILMNLNKKPEAKDIPVSDRRFLEEAECTEWAFAQQKVLSEGMGASQLWRTWNNNSKLLPNQVANLRAKLPPEHILQRVLAEHDMMLCFISDLSEINAKIQQLYDASSSTQEIRNLAHIVGHLVASQQHREREEEVIFPELSRRGYASLLRILAVQHAELDRNHQRLNSLVWKIDTLDFNSFKNRLKLLTEFLVPTIRMHFFIESNIIFPLALAAIKDKKVWQKMKEVCHQIGYCGYDGMLVNHM